MSYFTYDTLYRRAQKVGFYYLQLFHIVDSQKLTIEEFRKNQFLLQEMYRELEQREQQEKRRILHHPEVTNRLDSQDPFFFNGENMGFTIYRNVLTRLEIVELLVRWKQQLKIACTYQYQDGYYETDNELDGASYYFRGSALKKLEKLSKKQQKL